MSVPVVLKELHRLHKHLRALKAEIDLGPRVMTADSSAVTRICCARDDDQAPGRCSQRSTVAPPRVTMPASLAPGHYATAWDAELSGRVKLTRPFRLPTPKAQSRAAAAASVAKPWPHASRAWA